MKNVQLKTMQKLKEKTKEEQIATQSNKQLMDRIAQLESDLESQKLLNKDLKREKNQFEQQTLQNSAKVDQLQEVLKMFQPGQAQQPQHNMTPRQFDNDSLLYSNRSNNKESAVNNHFQGVAAMTEVDEMQMLANNEMQPDQMAGEQFRMVDTFREFTEGEDDEEVANQANIAAVELTTDFFTNEPHRSLSHNSIELIDDGEDAKIKNYQSSPVLFNNTATITEVNDIDQEMTPNSQSDIGLGEDSSAIDLLQQQAEAAEREADLTCRLQFVEVKKTEEQLSMDDGPSFVSPNGSFENVVKLD